MIQRPLLLAAGALLLAASAGCSSTSTAAQPPTPITATITDPVGDTNTGVSGTIYDITGVTTSRTGPAGGTYNQIAVTATFVQPVVLPAAGALPTNLQLAFQLYFDTDGNFTDGTNYNLCTTGGGGTYNGVDFVVDGNGATGNRLADGNYSIITEPAGTSVGEATVSVNGNSITWTIPISAIGNHPAGPFNFGMAAGNGSAPTDCAANSGFTAASSVVHQSGTPQGHTFTTWSN